MAVWQIVHLKNNSFDFSTKNTVPRLCRVSDKQSLQGKPCSGCSCILFTEKRFAGVYYRVVSPRIHHYFSLYASSEVGETLKLPWRGVSVLSYYDEVWDCMVLHFCFNALVLLIEACTDHVWRDILLAILACTDHVWQNILLAYFACTDHVWQNVLLAILACTDQVWLNVLLANLACTDHV